ncbi:MAG: methyl-accepting chemotaxis protein [Clostridia bacterium]|nr:methyl-accepting chemotaxis protein [Clostridia bacterium]
MTKKTKSNQKRISGKIAKSIIIINLIIVLSIAGVMSVTLKKNVGEEANKLAVSQVEAATHEFQQAFSNIESAVNVIVEYVAEQTDLAQAKTDKQYLQTLKKDILVPYLKRLGENTDLTSSIYVYYNTKKFGQETDIWLLEDESGKFVLQDSFGVEYYNDYNEWYSEPIDNGKTLWTYPYESAAGGLISSFITPVEVNGEIIALVGMDLYMEDIEKTLSEVKLFDTGYLYLMHPDGHMLVHPRMAFNQSIMDSGDYQFLLDEMASHDKGFTAYTRDDGENVVSAFDHLNNGWVIGSSIPEKEVLKILNVVLMLLAGVALIAIVLSAITSKVVGNSISKPIIAVVEATNKIKQGDFTVRVDVTSNDETKLLADGLNEMTHSVKALIQETKSVSSEMLDSASNLASMAEETTATVDQVASTVDEIKTGTQDTAADAEKGAMIASSIDEKFNVLMDNSSAMNEQAEIAIQMNQAGLKALEDLRDKSEISKASNVKVINAVQNLDERANAITNIIATISSIADQTNLLALNASIEAARAGEAGRGFAVVADEIRKLAEDSSTATNEIRDIVQNIQNESKETIHIMREVNEISNQQNQAVTNVTESFNQIFTSVEKITNQIEMVTHELDGLARNKTELVEIVNNISAVSEETAAATEEVNASMNEQAHAVSEVAKNAETLNMLSHDLNKHIDIFKI